MFFRTQNTCYGVPFSEVVQRCFVKKVFLKISQNSLEICEFLSNKAFYSKETLAQVFSCKFCELFKMEHLRTVVSDVDCCEQVYGVDLTAFRPATSLKKRLQNRCFPLKFAKFLRIPIWRTLRTTAIEGISVGSSLNEIP